MNPIRRAILIMPFLLPEALPARSPRSKVVVIPPHGGSMMPVVAQKALAISRSNNKGFVSGT
jgi:hypothetical protein